MITADSITLNISLYNLQNKILDGYNPSIRPVRNPNTTTFINVDLQLRQVLEMVNSFQCNINILHIITLIFISY